MIIYHFYTLAGENFTEYLPFFLSDVPGVKCAKAGHAAYGSAVVLDDENNTVISYFMTYHVCFNTNK